MPSFLTFDSINRKAVEQYFTVMLFFFLEKILENFSVLDLPLLGVKELKPDFFFFFFFGGGGATLDNINPTMHC